MSAINYSKWDHIEVSDDEDDTHPNIHTPSLFKWRHEARVKREDELKEKKQTVEAKRIELNTEVKEVTKALAEAKAASNDEELSRLEKSLVDLKVKEKKINEDEEEMMEEEKKVGWNVDNLSHGVKSRSVINKYVAPAKKEDSEENFLEKQKKFLKDNKDIVRKYGMLQRYEDSKELIQKHPELVCEEAANFLCIWCIDLVLEEKESLMEHVSHQVICLQYILELARQLETDPRNCVGSFFTKLPNADPLYLKGFHDEIASFRERVHERAQARIDDAMEEERKKRLGPGGLDPVEVIESFPQELRECFESQDVAKLKEVIKKLPPDEAEKHMKSAVDSGLWVENVNDTDGKQSAGDGADAVGGAGGAGGVEGEEESGEYEDAVGDGDE